MEQHFEFIHKTSFQSNSFSELQRFCTDFMAKSPEKIFQSLDFTSLSEKSLISLLKRDDLQMKEIKVWEHMLKWGLEKNLTLVPDPMTWSDDDFKMLGTTLQHCLPLIRFFSLSSEDFLQKIHPYKKLLKSQLYEDLLKFHLIPDSKPSDGILPPRNLDQIIDTKIVNLNIASVVSKWIDRVYNVKNKFIREPYLPYRF